MENFSAHNLGREAMEASNGDYELAKDYILRKTDKEKSLKDIIVLRYMETFLKALARQAKAQTIHQMRRASQPQKTVTSQGGKRINIPKVNAQFSLLNTYVLSDIPGKPLLRDATPEQIEEHLANERKDTLLMRDATREQIEEHLANRRKDTKNR